MPETVRFTDICTGHGCYPPRDNARGSPNVFANKLECHRVGDKWNTHGCNDDQATIVWLNPALPSVPWENPDDYPSDPSGMDSGLDFLNEWVNPEWENPPETEEDENGEVCILHEGTQATGSPNVFVNRKPLARIGDAIDCGSLNLTGSRNVITNG